MKELPPGRFSTTTGTFQARPSRSPSARETVSVGPPGGNGRIRWMGLDGYVSWAAAGNAAAPARQARASIRVLQRGSNRMVGHLVLFSAADRKSTRLNSSH